MRSPRPLALALALAAPLAPLPAYADPPAKALVEGERTGVLVPDSATSVRIDQETLSFYLRPDLASAGVIAAYRLTGGGPSPEPLDVAFTYVCGDASLDCDPGRRASIELDGAPLPFRPVSDADLLNPQLQTWLSEHPQVAALLERDDGSDPDFPTGHFPTNSGLTPLALAVSAAGGRCDGGCRGLVAWHRGTRRDPDDAEKTVLDAEILGAAREAVPAAVAALREGWTPLPDARLGFLFFHLDLQPHEPRTLTLHYEQRATRDRAAHVNDTYRFDYLLSPGRRWSSFGPLDITIHAPVTARFTSSLPFRQEGASHHAALPGLPAGELHFEVMSNEGLWLGQTQPRSYWGILAAAMTAAMASVGWAAGRRFRGAVSRTRRVVLPMVTAGPLATVCNVAVLVLLMWLFPPSALGFGYGGLFGGLALAALSLPVGAAVGAVSAGRRRREGAATGTRG